MPRKTAAKAARPPAAEVPPVDVAAFSIPNFSRALEVSRGTTYLYIKHGFIRTIQIGADKRIPASELQRIAAEGLPKLPKKAA